MLAVLANSATVESAPTGVVASPPPPTPVNVSLPVLSDGGQGGGTLSAPIVGDVLTGSNGTWTGAVRYTYQWEDCNSSGLDCAAISGATTSTYTIQSTDVGDTIVFQVTAYNS